MITSKRAEHEPSDDAAEPKTRNVPRVDGPANGEENRPHADVDTERDYTGLLQPPVATTRSTEDSLW